MGEPDAARRELTAAHGLLLEAFGPEHGYTIQALEALEQIDAGG